MPSCRLVSSLEDLKNGVAVCDLVAFLKSRPPFEGVVRYGDACRNPKEAALNNFEVCLRELGKEVEGNPEDFYYDTEKLIKLVEGVKNLIEPEEKEEVLKWVEEYFEVKSVEDLVENFRTGVMLADLVNRLEGREIAVKGIERNPKTLSAVQTNINKSLEALRKHPKMSSEHLFSAENIFEGNERVILGLLGDIRNCYCKFRRRNTGTPRKRNLEINTPKIEKFPVETPRNLCSRTPRSTKSPLESNRNLYIRTPINAKSPAETPRSTNFSSTPNSQRSNVSTPKGIRPNKNFWVLQKENISENENRQKIEIWLKKLGLGHYLHISNENYLRDPFKNGVLLSELFQKLESVKLDYSSIPFSTHSALENIQNCLLILKRRRPPLALNYLNEIHDFFKENFIWQFLSDLIRVYPLNSEIQSEESCFNLPYTPSELSALEKSLLHWISFTTESPLIQTFSELIHEIKEGVLLCDLVSAISETPIKGVFRSPKTDKIKSLNISKALEVLRGLPNMSQKFVWGEKKIEQGEYSCILGVLEDMNRLHDGLPPRKRGPNYHSDGPYTGKFRPCLTSQEQTDYSNTRLNFSIPWSIEPVHQPPPSKGPPSAPFSWIHKIIETDISIENDYIPEFKSGVLFYQLVRTLNKEEIKGIDLAPKSGASALHNIEKVLQVLRTKPYYPSHLFFVEEEILQGNGNVIREVLESVYRIFKTTIQNLQRWTSH